MDVCILSSMAMKAAKRFSVKTDTSVFKRLGSGNQENIAINHQGKNAVCKYWLEGRCTRNPCKFKHSNQAIQKSKYAWKNPNGFKSEDSAPIEKSHTTFLKNSAPIEKAQTQILKNSAPIEKAQTKILKNSPPIEKAAQMKNLKNSAPIEKAQTQTLKNSAPIEKAQTQTLKNSAPIDKAQTQTLKNSAPTEKAQTKVLKNEENSNQNQIVLKTQQKLLTNEVNLEEIKSIPKKNIKNQHSGFCSNGISMVTRLEGHTKAITGIALPSGSNKLYCGSKDKSLRVWDCNSGQCGAVVDFDNECGTLVNEGQWIFAGLRDMIKAWNLNTQHEVIIRAKGGQVNAITMFEDVLFAGMEDGSILSWKSTSESSFCEVATCLKGHMGSVLSLVVGGKKLYSGSADHTIRVWGCESLECMQVLHGHTGDVATVLCWDQYLLSGSSDKKIKVWGATENGSVYEVYEHNVNDGVVAFCGMNDAEGKPILLCSRKESGVCLYDLPTFEERGRVVADEDNVIQAVRIGPEGLFFTGDARGLVSVWKLSS